MIDLLRDHILSPNVTFVYMKALYTLAERCARYKTINDTFYIQANPSTNRFPWNQWWVTSIDIMQVKWWDLATFMVQWRNILCKHGNTMAADSVARVRVVRLLPVLRRREYTSPVLFELRDWIGNANVYDGFFRLDSASYESILCTKGGCCCWEWNPFDTVMLPVYCLWFLYLVWNLI